MHVKIWGTYVDSPIMTVHTQHRRPQTDNIKSLPLPIVGACISVGQNVDIELTVSEALALAADLIRAVNR